MDVAKRNLDRLMDQIRLDDNKRASLASSVANNAARYYQVMGASVPEILAKIEDIYIDFLAGKILQWEYPDTSDWLSVEFNIQCGILQLKKNCKTVTVEMKNARFAIILRLMVTK
jgi:hypothetical protein